MVGISIADKKNRFIFAPDNEGIWGDSFQTKLSKGKRTYKKIKEMSNKFFSTSIIVSLFALSTVFMASCSADSSTDILGNNVNDVPTAQAPFSFKIKTIVNGQDQTVEGAIENVTLFAFDQNNDFVKQISVDKASILNRKEIKIQAENSDFLTVIAWGGLSSDNEALTAMNEARIISDLELQLKQNNGIASTPNDLFYGKTVIYNSSTKSNQAQDIEMERKVSSISLTTKGLEDYFGSKEGNYVYKIKKTKSAFDYNGELTGEDVEYVFPASFDQNGELVTKTLPVLPSSEIAIELYRDNELIFSAKNDKKGQKLSASQGKQMNYIFKFSGKVTTNLTVSDWNTTVQYVTID